jgi:hypothetical protein
MIVLLLPGFTFLPSLGAIPIGLNIDTGYELADLKLQWLICDFGRRLSRYRQAGLAADIAQLQTERAYQTVANEVAVAYYQVLRTRALKKTPATRSAGQMTTLMWPRSWPREACWKRRKCCVPKSSWPKASACSMPRRPPEQWPALP